VYHRIIDKSVCSAEAISLKRALFFVFCWIFLRIFIEGVLEAHHSIGFASFSYKSLLTYFLHFPLFYASLFFLLVIIISALLKEPAGKVTKVASIGLGAIILVPLIDWSIGHGFMITYPLRLEPYFMNFLNPFVSLVHIGVSPGQRVVIVFISLLIAFYTYAKTSDYFRALGLFFLSLGVIIIFGGLTTLLAANHPERIFATGGILYTDTQKYCVLYLLLFSTLAFLYLFMLDRGFMRSVCKTLRLERMTFYGGLAIFGFGISLVYKGVRFQVGSFNYLGIMTMFLSLALGYWGLQVFNDLFDVGTDRMTGRNNPLLKGVKRENYRRFSMMLMALALCYAVIINFPASLILYAYLLLGILYSLPPVRLKRIPIVSTVVIAVAVILSIALGFSVYYGGQAINALPAKILLPTLLAVTLGFTAKDIGHIDGDKAHGVITLPVLLYKPGTFSGRLPIAGLVSVSYLIYAFFIPQVITGAVLFGTGTLLYTLFTKRTSELFYFVMLYLFGAYLFYMLIRISPL
jgi:4-hydroxybenzoate polyprenyltransferase